MAKREKKTVKNQKNKAFAFIGGNAVILFRLPKQSMFQGKEKINLRSRTYQKSLTDCLFSLSSVVTTTLQSAG